MDVVLASKEHDLRLALEMLLREEPGAYVVGTASHAEALLALVRSACPDLVLLDWDLPGQPPADVVAEVASADPRPKIIVICKDADASQVALAAGADESVVKGDPPELLLDALRQVSSQS
jgi:DNA-binding NarL/FixJ family response regulator